MEGKKQKQRPQIVHTLGRVLARTTKQKANAHEYEENFAKTFTPICMNNDLLILETIALNKSEHTLMGDYFSVHCADFSNSNLLFL